MNEILITSRLRYEVTERASFAFSIVAARTDHQTVTKETIDLGDDVAWTMVPYGSGTHQLLRLTVDPGELDLSYTASVTVSAQTDRPDGLDEVPFDEVPAEVLPYLNPSRYCESDRVGNFSFRLFGDTPAGYDRVKAISDWVHDNLVYESGSTDGSSSATDVLLQRAGVCRDFAHVAITLCRAIGVPARYVSGYGIGVDPQDFHGFFEAYVGTDWYLFDPTGMAQSNALVRIGYGRDAADAPFATLVGRADLLEKEITVASDGKLEKEPATASTA
ncbi:MAG: transglutaminase family protein [Ilumatobacter sp.]|uniref:transglutaminase-like domain-containing protein n=1 Tax=Ilumatobacter sp. TaxID=1967498 RepID=UPI003298DBA0